MCVDLQASDTFFPQVIDTSVMSNHCVIEILQLFVFLAKVDNWFAEASHIIVICIDLGVFGQVNDAFRLHFYVSLEKFVLHDLVVAVVEFLGMEQLDLCLVHHDHQSWVTNKVHTIDFLLTQVEAIHSDFIAHHFIEVDQLHYVVPCNRQQRHCILLSSRCQPESKV